MSDDVARVGFFGWKDAGCGDAEVERLAHAAIGAAIEVHRVLGPGLPESVYELALCHELGLRGIAHERQAPVPVVYKGLVVGEGKVDVLIGGRLVLELKACIPNLKLHQGQLISYLCALDLPLGLLINFHVPLLTSGINRVLNTHR